MKPKRALPSRASRTHGALVDRARAPFGRFIDIVAGPTQPKVPRITLYRAHRCVHSVPLIGTGQDRIEGSKPKALQKLLRQAGFDV